MSYPELIREAATEWNRHNAPRLGAALAYYTVLSLAPAVVFAIAVASFVFGERAAQGQVYWQIKDFTGDAGATAVQMLLRAAHRPGAGIIASLLGFSALLLGASGVFLELRSALNYIWGVPAQHDTGLWAIIRARLFSFAMVLGIGFLLLLSLVASAVLQGAGALLAPYLPTPPAILETLNFVLSLAATSFLFALIYRIVPEVRVAWRDIVIGAVTTAALFTAGKFLIGIYLGRASVGSAYGAAGSIVVLLVWVYYSSQIFLFGAEFTRVYSRHREATQPEIRGRQIGTIGPRHQPAPR
jgi:membrane protein